MGIMAKYGIRIGMLLLSVLVLAACQSDSGDPTEAVTTYLSTLVEKDREGFTEAICNDWERDGRIEFDSFGAVDASLNTITCEAGDAADGYTPVDCTGTIQVSYGGEREGEIDVAERTYRVVEEDGAWRMCGYVADSEAESD